MVSNVVDLAHEIESGLRSSQWMRDFDDLWPAVKASYEADESAYFDKILPQLDAWAAQLDEAPVWFIDDFEQIEQVKKIAPFALVGMCISRSTLYDRVIQENISGLQCVELTAGYQVDENHVISVIALPSLKLKRLRVRATITPGICQAIVDSPSAASIEHLALHHDPNVKKGAGGVDLIGKATSLTALKRLDLERSRMGLRAGKAILGLKTLKLTHLNLNECKLNGKCLDSLVKSPLLTSLFHLDLSKNKLGPDALVSLAYSEAFSGLKSLSVSRCELGMESLKALLDSPHQKLLSLDISNNAIQGATEVLIQATSLAQLERLDYNSVDYDRSMVDLLSTAEHLSSLRYLHLTSNAAKVIDKSSYLTQCEAVKNWGFNSLPPLKQSLVVVESVDEDVQEPEQVSEEHEPEGWGDAFGTLRALLQEFDASHTHELVEWLNVNLIKFEEIYTQQARPYLKAWADKQPEDFMIEVKSSAEFSTQAIKELAKLTRLSLQANDIKTKDLKSKTMEGVYELVLSSASNDRAALGRAKAIGASKYVKNLRTLKTWVHRFKAEGVEAIVSNKNLTSLTHLELVHTRMGLAGIKAIAESPIMANVRYLNLEGSKDGNGGNVGIEGNRALASSPYLSNLEVLKGLGGHDDGSAVVLADSTYFNALHTLEFGGRVDAEGVNALLAPDALPALHTLMIKNPNVDAIEAVVRSSGLSKLKHLTLWRCLKSEGSVVELANSPHVENLESLELPYAGIGNKEMTAIMNSPYLKSLKRLSLHWGCYNFDHEPIFMRADVLKLLDEAKGLENLESLDLTMCNLGPDEVQAIADSPFFSRIKVLTLRDNMLNRTSYEILSKSPHMANLERLEVMNATNMYSSRTPQWLVELLTDSYMATCEVV